MHIMGDPLLQCKAVMIAQSIALNWTRSRMWFSRAEKEKSSNNGLLGRKLPSLFPAAYTGLSSFL